MGLSKWFVRLELALRRLFFGDRDFVYSRRYWNARYRWGGYSGQGSRGRIAEGKIAFVNKFCREHDVKSLVELGSGDGFCAAGIGIGNYLGLDISEAAIAAARKRCAGTPHKFAPIDGKSSEEIAGIVAANLGALPEAALSMDVILHLVEDDVFETYLKTLFSISSKYILIFSTDKDLPRADHVRHRRYSKYVEANFPVRRLLSEGDKSHAHFNVYEKL